MGLFGGKKNNNTVKITDYYSEKELKLIRDTVEPKVQANAYGSIGQLVGKGLIDYMNRPEKEYSYNKMNSFMKIANSMKDCEPSIAEVLQNGIDKYRANPK